MTWNHRVIRHTWPATNPDDEDYIYYRVHEVYYDKNGTIEGWTQDAVAPQGETIEELNAELNMFIRATVLPILVEVDGKLVEI